MNTRLAALESLVKILENEKQYNSVIKEFSGKVEYVSEYSSLVSGVIKQKLTLDFLIENLLDKKIKKLSKYVKNILRLGIYELKYTSSPDYAVINSYVELVKKYNKLSTKFVNAILRRYQREADSISFPKLENDPAKFISISYSHPEWMVQKWLEDYGLEDTTKICEFNNSSAHLTVRINELKCSKENLIRLFKENKIEFIESIVPDCLKVKFSGDVRNINGYSEGFWVIQSESSSLVGHVLSPKPNDLILDVCAAPGGKTTHIASLMKNTGKILAVDINEERLKRIDDNCTRLGITNVETMTCDAVNCKFDNKFDKILVDAPCSNTGVLAKRVDARWNRNLTDIENLSQLQLKILNNISNYLKPGGTLVYSTCSIEKEENTNVIQKFLQHNSHFKPEKIQAFMPFKPESDDGCVQILQSKHNMDGFFIAKLSI